MLVFLFGLALLPSFISPACAAFSDDTADKTKSEKTNQAYIACEQIPATSPLKGKCQTCAGDIHGDVQGIWTAVGCISTDPIKMSKTAVYLGISIAGGIGLISIIVAGFLYTISTGDVKRTTQARELMTNTVIGLLFVIFSVTILQFIARDLLVVPGFGG